MARRNDRPRRYHGGARKWLKDRVRALEERCTHDSLTGLLNLNGFKTRVLERTGEMTHENKRSDDICHTAGGPVAIGFIDLDRFNEVNGTLGHSGGDETLRVLAGIILGNIVRGTDVVGRRSGDEFLVALFNIDKVSAGERIAEMRERFKATLRSKFGIDSSSGFSFGISEMFPPADARQLERALEEADAEMYKYKKERGAKR